MDEPQQRKLHRRVAARVLLIDPQERVLLMQLDLPWLGPIWLVPGGGLEAVETPVEGARRELFEETGWRLEASELAGPVWRRSIEVERAGGWVATDEHYFAARTPTFTPQPGALTPEEKVWLMGWKWWGPQELRATSQRVAPPCLARRLPALVTSLDASSWSTVELPAKVYPKRGVVVGS